MKKSIVIILTSLLVAPLPFSCDRTSSGGNYNFQIEELSIQAGQFDKENPTYIQPVSFEPAPTDTLRSNEFGIALSISKVTYLAIHSRPKLDFIQSATAERAPARSAANITLISIYSPKNVYANGEVYEPTESLTSLFKASSSDYYRLEFLPVLKFIEDFNRWEQGMEIFLILDAYLDQPLAQKLKVIVTMDDGTVFELETEKVVVK